MDDQKIRILRYVCESHILSLDNHLYIIYSLSTNIKKNWLDYIERKNISLSILSLIYNYYIYLSYIEL